MNATIRLAYNNSHPGFEITEGHKWFVENWSLSFYISAVYVVLIFSVQRWMTKRPRFELTLPLFVWNLALSAFSIIGSWRALHYGIPLLEERGFTNAICDNSFFDRTSETSLWTFLYAVSKVPELGDTAFIVLRKQPLMFLHWYHHITVMLYSWYSYSTLTSSSGLFGGANMIIHAWMYTYYAVKSLKVRIPRAVSMFITILQLSQMALGCSANFVAYQQLRRGAPCDIKIDNIVYSFLMYFSYLCLFAHFFYRAYMTGKSIRSVVKGTDDDVKVAKKE